MCHGAHSRSSCPRQTPTRLPRPSRAAPSFRVNFHRIRKTRLRATNQRTRNGQPGRRAFRPRKSWQNLSLLESGGTLSTAPTDHKIVPAIPTREAIDRASRHRTEDEGPANPHHEVHELDSCEKGRKGPEGRQRETVSHDASRVSSAILFPYPNLSYACFLLIFFALTRPWANSSPKGST